MRTLAYQLKIVGENLEMTLKGVTQRTGIDFATLSRIERDVRKPTKEQSKRLANLYNIKLQDIYGEVLSDKIVYLLKNEKKYKKNIKSCKK